MTKENLNMKMLAVQVLSSYTALKMSSIEDLPAVTLAKIFNSEAYWSPDMLETVSQASTKISSFIEEYKRYGQWFTFVEIDDDNTRIQCRCNKDGKFVHLEVDTMNPILYPEILCQLQITGVIQLQDYNTLAERLVNLRSLEIGWLNLEVAGNPMAWTTFPELRELVLGGPCGKHGLPTLNVTARRYDIKGNSKPGANNFGGLIALFSRTNYPKLKTLGLSIIFEIIQENVLVNAMLSFLNRHQKTLKTFWILMAANLDTTNQGFLKEDWTHVPNFESRLEQLSLNLNHFILHFYPYVEAKKFLQLVDRISITQKSIQTHTLLYPRFQAFYTDLFEDNFRTLTHVAISIWIFDTLDCKVFENCKSLSDLLLHARPKTEAHFDTENYRGEPARSELTNIQYLPNSLAYIEIVNFFLETKDTLYFTQDHFPHLFFLCLEGIGEKENLGCSLEYTSELIYRGLSILQMYRGFNRRLMQVNEMDDPSVAFFKMTLLSAWAEKFRDHIWSISAYTAQGEDPHIEDYRVRDTSLSAIPMQLYDIFVKTFHDGKYLLLKT